MIIPEVAPMLTCTAGSDGFLYELVLRAEEGKPAITKIRIGPYFFRHDYTPQPLPFGLTRGGPESGFWMHKRAPRGWSRLHWEVAENEPDTPTYLVSTGTLAPGDAGHCSGSSRSSRPAACAPAWKSTGATNTGTAASAARTTRSSCGTTTDTDRRMQDQSDSRARRRRRETSRPSGHTASASRGIGPGRRRRPAGTGPPRPAPAPSAR